MREIKFRGLTVDGEWVYGDLYNDLPGATAYYNECPRRIVWQGENGHLNQPVKNGTEGQYTGLKDKNGKEIYEGDVCKTYEIGYGVNTDVVCFDNGSFIFRSKHRLDIELRGCKTDYIEIIGNIHENLELLVN